MVLPMREKNQLIPHLLSSLFGVLVLANTLIWRFGVSKYAYLAFWC